ncbi:MAG: hypothetical protein EPO11_06605 [Gammaproteobacteria bacterium]|nr:MAG: hypothetical protein EPO11_06605 [Gammaproteobacteria bacterium]
MINRMLDRVMVVVCCLLFPFLLGASTMIDPTRPPGTLFNPAGTDSSAGSLTVSAIFIYPNYRVAIINGRPVMVGDHLGDFTITSIMPFTVELIGSQNNQEVLPLVATVKQERP